MKCCQYIASLYPHIFTNFGQFTIIFNKMALIFLGVLIVFNVSSFQFHQVKLLLGGHFFDSHCTSAESDNF